MPSGKVHDRITLLTAAVSVPAWWLMTNGEAAAAQPQWRDTGAFACGLAAYLFSGFWLSDDLDTRSLCYRRWGALRILWWPYRKLVPHRSWLSHGLGVGPLLRVAYFAFVVWLAARCVLWAIDRYVGSIDRPSVLHNAGRALIEFIGAHPTWTLSALIGLILGGVAHTIADTVVSFARRVW